MDPITPETPEASEAPVTRKTKTLKIHLYPEDAAAVKTAAHQHELSQSEFGRFRMLGQTYYSLPDASKLEAICRQLAGIASNINQQTAATNTAQKNGTLTRNEFAAMHKVLTDGMAAWADPLAELKAEMQKFKMPQP